MYIPKDFEEADLSRIAALVKRHSFALLVTIGADDAPFATHLPLLYDPARGTHGTLLGHVARANPQWRHFEAARDALAVFTGPHAYVSPSWYETQPSVPTWNYAAVHLYGRPRIVDGGGARAILSRLVDTYEAGSPAPWPMELPPDYEAAMLKGIVAFEIAVTKIEAKFKLSQNRKAADRASVAEKLAAAGSDGSTAVARLMRGGSSAARPRTGTGCRRSGRRSAAAARR